MSWGQPQIDALVHSLISQSAAPPKFGNAEFQTNIAPKIETIAYNATKLSWEDVENLRLIIKPHERREDVRVPVNLGLDIRQVLIESSLVVLDIPMDVRAVDLSSGGIRLASFAKMPLTSFSFCFELPIREEKLTCIAEVTRRDCLKDIQIYGCRFLNLDSADKSKIRNFVFTEQIRLRKQIYCRDSGPKL